MVTPSSKRRLRYDTITEDLSIHRLRMDQRPTTASKPASISSNLASGNLPTRSKRRSLSKDRICEAFATESCGRCVIWDERRVLPGEVAQVVLVVRGMQTTVAIRLRLKAS